MRSSALRNLLSLVLVAATFQQGAAYSKVKESITTPRGWTRMGAPSPDHRINLRIALPQSRFDELERHLYEVSDPDHARYGDHLSKEEVEALIAPHPESVDLVNEWLASHGISENDMARSPARDWVTLNVPVSLAEKMLETTYSVWRHHTGDTLVRTTSYSLPENIFSHVDLVQPTTSFGRLQGFKATYVWGADEVAEPVVAEKAYVNANTGVTVDPSCNSTVTITCLKQLYNAVGYVPKAKGNSIGITGYLEEYANIQDLQSFYKDQVPEAVNSTFKFISVKGGINDQNLTLAGAEAGLDVQFAFGVSYPIPGTFYSTAGRTAGFKPDLITPDNSDEPYIDWLDHILKQKDVPLTISTSYGDDEQTLPKSLMIRECAGFAQLGARGVSLMFSSGDGGVGDNNPDPKTTICKTNDGRNATRFMPSFPTSCPFVTSVGGTAFIPEVAVSRFYSGGGFSDIFPRPSYQKTVVDNYLSKLPKNLYEGLYNPAGRAYPDVSALADRYRIFLSGKPILIGGTSASSPAFSGLVALLNDVRLSNGKKPLGFLNPLLYSKGANAFNDITIGKNPGCGTNGFNATQGWDPVTGLGTPDFGKLSQVVLEY